MSPALRSLEYFLELSEAMAGAALAQDWDILALEGEKRIALLKHLPANLSAELAPDEFSRARTIVEHCQQLDTQTRLRVEAQQKALRILLRETSDL